METGLGAGHDEGEAQPKLDNEGPRGNPRWRVLPIMGDRCTGLRRIADFLEIARLQRPNPLLYRCFPLTCARSQE